MDTAVQRLRNGFAALALLLPLAALAAAPDCAPMKILPNGSLPQAVVGDPYTATLSATEGGNPVATPNYVVSRGVLPSGLSLSSAGAFSGTPTAAGDTPVRIGVVDTVTGCSGQRTYVVHVVQLNHAPSFTKGADQSVLEDVGPQTVPGWATAISDNDGNTQTLTFSVTGNTNPALFSAAPAVDAATGTLTYTPAPNANGSATVTLVLQDNGGTANGGMDTSAPQTFVITVTAVNDAPSFTKGADQSVAENAGAQSVPNWATAISAGPADESGQTLTFNVIGNSNPALFSAGPAVASNGTLSFTPAANANGNATITVQLQDNGGTANGGVDTSTQQTFTITVTPVNHAPSFTKGADQTVLEDAGAQTVAGWATAISDNDGNTQTLTFNVTGNSNPGLFSAPPSVDATTGTLTYTPAANANGTATITLTLQDNGGTANGGSDTSAPQTFVISVTAVNDAPSFTAGANPSVAEDSGAQTLPGWASGLSPGPADESGQTVTIQITGNDNPGLFAVAPAIDAAGTLTFTPAPNANGVANVTVVAKDNGGTANGGVDTSAPQTLVITVLPVNDVPAFTKGSDLTSELDNAGPRSIAGWATGISAGPPDEAGQALNFIVSNDNNGAFSAQPAIDASGNLTFTAAPQGTAGSKTATVTVQIHDNGGTANGGVDTSAAQTFVITITHANVAPTLGTATITYSTLGNTQLHVAGAVRPGVVNIADVSSIAAKASPADSDGPSPVSVVAVASGTSANGGNYTINTDGSFTFVPPAGFTGTDTFPFQVTDGQDTASGTVSVSVSGKVWYVRDLVDANNPAGGDGRSSDAFETLSAAQAASAVNDTIFVFAGNTGTTPLASGIVLKNGQKLWGEGIGLTVAPFGTLVPAGSKPRVATSGTDAVSVPATAGPMQNIEVRGLDLASSGGTTNAVDVTASGANAVGVTISDNAISGSGLEGVDLNDGSTGTFVAGIANNTVTAAGNGIDARTSVAGANLQLAIDNNTNITAGSTGIVVDGSGGGTATITSLANNTVSGNTVSGGISVNVARFDATPGGGFQTVSGGTTVIGSSANTVGGAGLVLTGVTGDLSFADLDVYAGAGDGLKATSSGVFNAGSGTGLQIKVAPNVGIVEATGGAALNLSAVTTDLTFTSIKSSNSATTGVNLDAVAGVVAAGAGSSISGTTAAATAFRVNASNATVNYGGTISATAGTGVSLTGNTGSSINFSGAMTLSTGTNPAFTATGGGSVTATDTTSTLTTTTATALNVANTTIGASGLKFLSVSAGTAGSGPTSGIVLNTTGASGGLTVSGNGTNDGSGGTIQRTSAEGILLTNTLSPSFRSMKILNTAKSGIGGTQVTNFSFVNGTIDASGAGAATGSLYSNIAFNTPSPGTNPTVNNIAGTLTVTGSTLTNAYYSGVDIQTAAGTVSNAVLSNNTITSPTSASASFGYGINIVGVGSASTVFSLNKATIDANTISNFPGGGGIQVNVSQGNAGGPGGTAGIPGDATNIVTITNNLIRGASTVTPMNTNAVAMVLGSANSAGRSRANFNIAGNGTLAAPLANMVGTAILVGNNGYSTMTGTVSNNVIVANNSLGSNGIGGGNGVSGAGNAWTPDLTLTVNNNTISQTDGNGILLVGRGTSGTAKLKIQNNTVAAPLSGLREGIRVDAGNTSSANDTVCLNIAGNTTAGSFSAPNQAAGIGLRKQGTSTSVNVFGINGLAPSPAGTPTVENYVNSLNPGSASGNFGVGGTDLISATSGFTSCNLP